MPARMDRSSPLPLWAQIVDDLHRRLTGGEFEQRFPTDAELMRDYGVSRHTVREAVRRLTAEGRIVRQRGRGTSVAPVALEQPLHSLYSLASTVRATGTPERSDVLHAERRPAPPEIAQQLGVAPGADLVHIERLRLADDAPLAWDRSWLPADRAAPLLDLDLTSGGLYDALTAACAVRITGGWERIRPVVPTREEQRLLALPDGVAAFSTERLVFAGTSPIEWRRSLIRGDRFWLLAEWPAPTGGSTDDTPTRFSPDA